SDLYPPPAARGHRSSPLCRGPVMSVSADRYRVLRLLGDLCNGRLDAKGEQFLQQLLGESAEARALYMDAMAMEACLVSEGQVLATAIEGDTSDAVTSTSGGLTVSKRPRANWVAGAGTSLRRFLSRRSTGALAAALVAVAFLSSFITYGLRGLTDRGPVGP